MEEENKLLNTLMRKYEFAESKRLSKKDLGEVYLVQGNNQSFIIKIQKDMINYKRETETLRLLNEKFPEAPVMTECGIIDSHCGAGYFIQEFWSGSTLLSVYDNYNIEKKLELMREAGELLGRMNKALSKKELEESGLWKYAYEDAVSFSNYRWINIYRGKIEEWLGMIKYKEYKEKEFFRESADTLWSVIHTADSNGNLGLLHRDFGFRNIMTENGHIKGVIDFEYAAPGDISFDLSKLIFNDLDFAKDVSLRNAFFSGWEKSTGQSVDWNRLWMYLAVQGFGAVQWVDRQDLKLRMENADYREKGVYILKEACKRLREI